MADGVGKTQGDETSTWIQEQWDLKNDKGSMRDDSDSSAYDGIDNLRDSDPYISSVQDKEKENEETNAVDTGDDGKAKEGECNACCGMDHTPSDTKMMTRVEHSKSMGTLVTAWASVLMPSAVIATEKRQSAAVGAKGGSVRDLIST